EGVERAGLRPVGAGPGPAVARRPGGPGAGAHALVAQPAAAVGAGRRRARGHGRGGRGLPGPGPGQPVPGRPGGGGRPAQRAGRAGGGRPGRDGGRHKDHVHPLRPGDRARRPPVGAYRAGRGRRRAGRAGPVVPVVRPTRGRRALLPGRRRHQRQLLPAVLAPVRAGPAAGSAAGGRAPAGGRRVAPDSPAPGWRAIRPALALSLAWLLVWPFQRPWYDAMVFCLLALFPASRLDWPVLARLGAGTLYSMPGMPGPLPAVFFGLLPVEQRLLVPLIRLAALLAVMALCLTGAWQPRRRTGPPRRWGRRLLSARTPAGTAPARAAYAPADALPA